MLAPERIEPPLKRGCPPHRTCISANDADTHFAMGVAGLGLAQCPSTQLVADHIAARRLVAVLPSWNAGRLPLVVMYPPEFDS
jgi:DNA-binding transcriptional LysR family regulator